MTSASKPFYKQVIYLFCKNLVYVVLKLVWRMKVVGRENIPIVGGVIIAANHRSYADPPVVGSVIARDVHFMAKEELFRFRPFGWLIETLNAHPLRRSGDVRAFKTALNLLNEGNVVILFPEGRRIKTDDMAQPKPGVGLLAHSSGCTVIPTYIHNTSYFRRFKKVVVQFGPPLIAQDYDSHQAIADEVMIRIQRMKERI